MKIGLIVDNSRVASWQAEALLAIASDAEFVIYNCANSRAAPRRLRHAAYYALRLAALTTRRTRSVSLPPDLRIVDRVDFESGFDGQWQTLPPSVVERISSDGAQLLIKFGMGLLRVPAGLRIPILSYHHGDPRAFRGRPAGFYELLEKRSTVGQVVQLLSDRLDAGEVVAFGETRVHPHSYRATMDEAFGCSPLLLPIAVRNALGGTRLPIVPDGRNCRLPSNVTVIRFIAARAAAFARRIAYGLFVEKAWQVAESELQAPALTTLAACFPARPEWRVVPTPGGHRFIADPFYDPRNGSLLVEAFRARRGLGEIVRLGADGPRTVSEARGHLSYPATLDFLGAIYVLPEMSEWSRPYLFKLNGDRLDIVGPLDMPGRPRLLDPTLFAHEGKLFLFANIASESLSVLRLWVADAPLGPYREHPSSPIRISPGGSRMGGAIARLGEDLVRVGQDLRGAYGDGVVLFGIREISETAYREEPIGDLRFTGVRGPHTLNFGSGTMVFDFYRDRFSPLAGVRRIRGRLQRRS